MDDSQMRRRARAARVARLATVRPDSTAHAVACCFTIAGEAIYSPIDHKPKTTTDLQRLRNLREHPSASLLIDHYDEDWDELWWVRVDGTARILESGSEHYQAILWLRAKYGQYQRRPPDGPVIAIDIERWTAWP